MVFVYAQRIYLRTTHKKCAKLQKIFDIRKKKEKNLHISKKICTFAADL